ncbi:SDR family oxidoreductase [Stackebrandtia nassauensis]|uniref:NmrA family protein n=1 Tax=Stackebrandtia nassauensis (strain DSM 44728 / CIP 108903 / NRRL B-16338 / NBRC 102104 / LLR-40K-21) TaxID=446470 RepID=D3PUA1_STANL|nr:NAD(P)H-binding protein [Stackebrandtia nassauensis]ADD41047.1 NmrA family protein [Stackebrandtia nassauensis DSM 44728]
MTFLVTGATGNVGRHIVEQLVAAGAPTRALTRNPAKANLPAEAEVIAGDLTRTDTLAAAFEGVTAAHFINFGGDNYELLSNGQEIVDLALKAGVKRVTLLGAWDNGSLEDAVDASTLQWTRVGPGEFMSNALGWAEAIRTTGVVEEPFPDGHSPMSHEADIAAVAVKALLEEGHHGKTIQVAGPSAVSLRDKIRIIGEAIGKDIKLVELTPEQTREREAANGISQELIDFKINVFGSLPTEPYPLEGAAEFEKFTGKKPRDFKQWAAENADAFR